jgi:hypothetical protein
MRMETIHREAKELFTPTARGFKGMTILFGIWGVACLLICGLVPQIIFTHLNNYPDIYTATSSSTDA